MSPYERCAESAAGSRHVWSRGHCSRCFVAMPPRWPSLPLALQAAKARVREREVPHAIWAFRACPPIAPHPCWVVLRHTKNSLPPFGAELAQVER